MRWVRLSKYKRIELKLGPSGPNGAKWLVAQKSSHVADANPRMRALHAAAPTNADVFLETHSVTLILNHESIDWYPGNLNISPIIWLICFLYG